MLASAAMPHALICAQAFPPLLKQARVWSAASSRHALASWKVIPCEAGGVAKDYLALCRALIDGLGWEVTLLSPVSIGESGEADVEPPGQSQLQRIRVRS